jgi:proton-translocating NAD(P)+ transhydrogenase subunit beta
MTTQEVFTQGAYLAASVLFILGLKGLSSPATARRGILLAEIGMLLAVIGTLVQAEIVRYEWIIAGLALGSAIGAPLAVFVPMTAMPQRIAISHMFGALAATLVGVAEYTLQSPGTAIPVEKGAVLGFEVLFGSLTITGSFMAFGKLQGLIPGRPLTYRFQNASNVALIALTFAIYGYLVITGASAAWLYAIVGLGLLIGVLMVLPIGGADMPVVVSLLNSYAGLASAATGLAIGNNVLVIAGALDGASGFILSILMSRAMNRSFANVLFGAFGGEATSAAGQSTAAAPVRSLTPEDAAIQLAYARLVIMVPGYGLAVSQAQHHVRELANEIEKRGGEVKYAIHPVAGRMPGHMNVLLAEANVPYDKLHEMERINGEFDRADVALVVGANDIVNPAARTSPGSPLYGMPILNVDQARSVIVLKRGMSPGFSGMDNDLFSHPSTSMLFGDAKRSLATLVSEIQKV